VRLRAGPALAALAAAALCACPAPSPRTARPAPVPLSTRGAEGELPAKDTAGVVHVVRRGQTLYRIARAYGVDPAELMAANGISDPRTLAVGQELVVPGATEALDVDDPALPRKPTPGEAPPAPEARPAPAAAEARPPAPEARPPPLAWPLRGVLYGRFGIRGGTRHDGIDIAAPEGSPVLAAADGVVIYVGEQSGYGTVVILRHDRGLVTVYAHNSAVLVREGDRVARGQPVAKVGQTGRTTGPHLHFEVREGTRPRDPLLFLP
jgi:lipoprotein NlpD